MILKFNWKEFIQLVLVLDFNGFIETENTSSIILSLKALYDYLTHILVNFEYKQQFKKHPNKCSEDNKRFSMFNAVNRSQRRNNTGTNFIILGEVVTVILNRN